MRLGLLSSPSTQRALAANMCSGSSSVQALAAVVLRSQELITSMKTVVHPASLTKPVLGSVWALCWAFSQ